MLLTSAILKQSNLNAPPCFGEFRTGEDYNVSTLLDWIQLALRRSELPSRLKLTDKTCVACNVGKKLNDFSIAMQEVSHRIIYFMQLAIIMVKNSIS
jgi:hypothetical protein